MRQWLIGMAMVVGLVVPASAHHHSHHHHWIRHTEWRADYGHWQRAGSDLASWALARVGWGNITGFRGPWCAAFVNVGLSSTGHRHVASRRAIDAIGDGMRVRRPERGDLAVMRHHVTIFVGWGGRGFVAVGGNQGHGRVTVSSYPLHRVIAWVRPG